MPRDAKLGFVLGVALVIVVGVVFYQSNGSAGAPGNLQTSPTDLRKADARQANAGLLPTTPVPGVPSLGVATNGRSHTVQEGETLSSLARRYYNDPAQSSLLFRANRSQLRGPDHLPVGTVLLIP